MAAYSRLDKFQHVLDAKILLLSRLQVLPKVIKTIDCGNNILMVLTLGRLIMDYLLFFKQVIQVCSPKH